MGSGTTPSPRDNQTNDATILAQALRPIGDHGKYAALAARRTIAFGIVTLIRHRRARRDVRTDVERDRELRAVADLAAGQVEGDWQAIEVRLEVDFTREPAARAPEGLILLPPFAPAAETCVRTTVLSNICTRCAVLLVSAKSWENASNTPERLRRQNRFHTLFQLPYSPGSARQAGLFNASELQ